MNCKICGEESLEFAHATILHKHKICYFKCSNCSFIQTEEPYWLEEAYTEAIANSDVGLVHRNIMFSRIVENIIYQNFQPDGKFLDYGGGYGLFVRLMRDLGLDFYWHDQFCQNIFAHGLEAEKQKYINYELVTAFEVFEHFVNPLSEIEKILEYSRNILFSTELLPSNNPKPNQWWYYALEEGQHISLYTKKSLLIIAQKFNLNLYSNGSSLHLLTENKFSSDLFERASMLTQPRSKNQSLIEYDYLKITGKLTESNTYELKKSNEIPSNQVINSTGKIKIAVDGVFFQLYQTGIARVWKSLLEEWAINGFAQYIFVLDRAGTAPKVPGIKYRQIPAYDYKRTDVDREMLQQICEEEQANLFISTYYTTPISIPSVFMAYDMIPEVLGANLNSIMWQEKHKAINQAFAYITISENTARDLIKFFPSILPESVKVAHCGVNSIFFPASLEEVNNFRIKYGISKPYFLGVGVGSGYKNTIFFLKAFAQLYSKNGFDLVFTGSGSLLEDGLRVYTAGSVVHMLQLSDEELKAAYSGAIALVYPSLYEGFGLPVLEALACGCPVITCPNASIPEVAGEAALYVNNDDINGMINALCDIQKPDVRNLLINAGLEQAKKFSWSKMAQFMSSSLIEATILPLNLRDINLIIFPDWSASEDSIYLDLEPVIKTITTHQNRNHITLLIDTTGISEEDANLFLSGIAVNLLMQEDLDISEESEISLLGHLDKLQWDILSPRLNARIILPRENQAAVAQLSRQIPSYQIDQISEEELVSFFLQLSNRLFQQRKWQEALANYQKIIATQTADAEIYWRCGECYRHLNCYEQTVLTLQQGIQLHPTDGNLHFSLIFALQTYGRIQEAISSAYTASKLLSNDYTFKIIKNLLVPIIYETESDITFYRKQFMQGLNNLIEQTSLETLEEQESALLGLGRFTNFYLAHQGQDDQGLQRQYGSLVHKIMAANYPKWISPLSMPPLTENHKIRIGYVSAYLHSYSGTLWLTGWLSNCNREIFEVYCYYIGNEPDSITQQFQRYSDVFHHIPHNLSAVCKQIIADQLHILVFPEIGMNPQTLQMAALRLAPVQCVAWGHPVTTGLPTIDYFLSSELMEPENAQDHYSETLIRLPNIGVSYPKPTIPTLIKTRGDFQLWDDSVIYLCCQAPFKYLPQYDFIFPEIALCVPQAQFLFLRGSLLKPRLSRAFATAGLNSEDYCVFLTIPERLDYLMINLLSDIYLDTFSWSGGNTTLEAIACNLPVVTCPGKFMRGRHSDSFLKMLGVTDTIAQNEAEYIEIAVKLGLDPVWRNNIAQRMSDHDKLYDDKACVAGLEAFYQQIVQESLM